VALFGVLFSAYLTIVSLTILGAACPYCLTSLGLMTSIFALVTAQRPSTLEGFSWRRWLSRTVPVAVAIIVVLHLNYTGLLGEPPAVADPIARALAIHLTQTGAKMYGASWCPHCQDQKDLFGAAANRLPYIECSTGGQGSPQTPECRTAGITTYPTWIINGKRTEEVMTLPQLAAATGFQPPGAAPAQPGAKP
jgi:glutaredoxin